ncbi:probable G-protein coupled receptor 160 [Lepisosteus oculatus]|uniref:probable G-protein coupled receptor 160 n=1 Tax=Lepisosteus oculatus TaxID=7918 RepID=UPI003714F606
MHNISNSIRSMMAILKTKWHKEDSVLEDNTLQFVAVLLFKVALNALVTMSSFKSMRKSFMGFFCMSLFIADVALLCGLATVWLIGDFVDTPQSLCYILAHASTAYRQLPLPVLLLGTLDYARSLRSHPYPMSWRRAILYIAEMLLVWALAMCYAYRHTNATVLVGTFRQGQNALFCPVLDSKVIIYFCIGTTLGSCGITLYFWRQLPRVFRTFYSLDLFKEAPEDQLHSDLAFSYRKLSQEEEELVEDGKNHAQSVAEQKEMQGPPLLLSITFVFTINWIAFLMINIICTLLDFAIPSYMNVNLLWMLCANSFLIGVVSWVKRRHLGTLSNPPDDICNWSAFWRISREMDHSLQDNGSQGIHTMSERIDKNLLLV